MPRNHRRKIKALKLVGLKFEALASGHAAIKGYGQMMYHASTGHAKPAQHRYRLHPLHHSLHP